VLEKKKSSSGQEELSYIEQLAWSCATLVCKICPKFASVMNNGYMLAESMRCDSMIHLRTIRA
jgi:hypothetical protein